MEYRARSGTVTRRAELAPITELNCPTSPQAKTEVDVRTDESTNEEAETPPLAAVAQQMTPRPARGRTTDFRVKRWRLKVN